MWQSEQSERLSLHRLSKGDVIPVMPVSVPFCECEDMFCEDQRG